MDNLQISTYLLFLVAIFTKFERTCAKENAEIHEWMDGMAHSFHYAVNHKKCVVNGDEWNIAESE